MEGNGWVVVTPSIYLFMYLFIYLFIYLIHRSPFAAALTERNTSVITSEQK